jgi:Uma2 family endonuclease
MAVVAQPSIPKAKPAFELIDDRLCQKVSPTYDHSRMQEAVALTLRGRLREYGRVGIEWRFTFVGPSGRPQSLVPDVGYLSFNRIPRERRADAQHPDVPPDIAVEILSPGDWRGQVERKREIYLATGTRLVVEIDPVHRTAALHDRFGSRVLDESGILSSESIPELSISLAEIFAALDDP